ncbi:MAG: MBL fold metallo-hydrolase, partial [Acidobacteriota bacterium]
MEGKNPAGCRSPFPSASSPSSAALRLCVNLLLFASPLLAQQASVTQLTADVYLFRFGFHSNIFVVTPEGVVATDPIGTVAARLCLEEIRKVTDQPVRYVIYSHDHTDHIAGGAVFQPGAQFVAHRSALEVIRQRGVKEIVEPDVLVGERHELRLGGKVIQLFHLGRIESESNIAIYLPQDKVLMWVDAVRSYGVPYRYLEGTDLRHFRRALEEVEKLDFDHLVHGHGPSTDKSQVTLFRRYFDDLDRFTRQEMKKYP